MPEADVCPITNEIADGESVELMRENNACLGSSIEERVDWLLRLCNRFHQARTLEDMVLDLQDDPVENMHQESQ